MSISSAFPYKMVCVLLKLKEVQRNQVTKPHQKQVSDEDKPRIRSTLPAFIQLGWRLQHLVLSLHLLWVDMHHGQGAARGTAHAMLGAETPPLHETASWSFLFSEQLLFLKLKKSALFGPLS